MIRTATGLTAAAIMIGSIPMAGPAFAANHGSAATCSGGNPQLAAARLGGVAGVAATSSCNAWSVGGYLPHGSFPRTLIERWNGTAWRLQRSPNPGGATVEDGLTSVAARTSASAWAVGYSIYPGANSAFRGFCLHWDGKAWKQVPSVAVDGELLGVAVTPHSHAWAVGFAYVKVHRHFYERTFIEHWNGRVWRQTPSKNPGGPQRTDELSSVAVTSATDAWAVGSYRTGPDSPSRNLIEHWNGTAWKVVASPNFTSPANRPGPNSLRGVTAISPSDAWAVGTYPDTEAGTFQALVLHWNGKTWSRATNPSAGRSELVSVASAGPSDVWAVGNYTQPGARGSFPPTQILIEHWNGSGWQVSAPPIDSLTHWLSTVAATSASDVWAIGQTCTQLFGRCTFISMKVATATLVK